MRAEETIKAIMEYVASMNDGQIVCREIIVSRFLLSNYFPRKGTKEVLWALDRQNIVHVSEKIKCIQCKNAEGQLHRIIIKLGTTNPREKVIEAIKNLK